jgi:hypothetical protein
MNSRNRVKNINAKTEFSMERRAFVKGFPQRLGAIYLLTNTAITAAAASVIAGCSSTHREIHDRPDYLHPWERDYLTKTVRYDKIKTLITRKTRIRGTYLDWQHIIPAKDPLVRDELNEINWLHDFGDERDIVLSVFNHISVIKSNIYIDKIRKRINTSYYGGCKELSAMMVSLSIASGVGPEKLAFISGQLHQDDETFAHSWVGYRYTHEKFASDRFGIDFFLNSSGFMYYSDAAAYNIFKPARECEDYYHNNIQSCYDGSLKEYLWTEKQDVRSLVKKGYVIEKAL